MVTRCEIDMVEIKSKFLYTYGKTLGSFIKVFYLLMVMYDTITSFISREIPVVITGEFCCALLVNSGRMKNSCLQFLNIHKS